MSFGKKRNKGWKRGGQKGTRYASSTWKETLTIPPDMRQRFAINYIKIIQTIGFGLLCLCGALCLVVSNKGTGRQLTSFLCVVRMVSNMGGPKSRRQISPEALNHIKGSSARSRRFCFNFHKRGMLDVWVVRLLALLVARKNLARSTCDVSDISTELLP